MSYKTIYLASTPFTGAPPQKVHCTVVAEVHGKRYRANIIMDCSYKGQSHGEVALFIPGRGFEILLNLQWNEIHFVKFYHEAKPAEQGELIRSGQFNTMLERSAQGLIIRGDSIVNGAQ